MAADEIEQFRRDIDRAHWRRDTRGRQDRRGHALARGHEHRRQEGQARRASPLRRLRLHADRRLGRQHRDPYPRRARLRHPAPLRAGRRPRPSPPVLRSQRREACSTSNMPTCSAFRSTSPPSPWSSPPRQAARDGAGARGQARIATRWKLCSRASRAIGSNCRTNGSMLRFGPELGAGPDARAGRAVGHQEPGHHRRGRRSDACASRGHAPVDGPVPPGPASPLQQVPRSRRRAEAAPVRPTEADYPAMARWRLSANAPAAPIRRSSCTRRSPTWRPSASRRRSPRPWPASGR